MKATVLEGPYRFRLEKRPMPPLEPGGCSLKCRQQALDLMQSAQLTLEPIITHQILLSDVDRGFKMMLDRTRSHAIKVVVLPHGGTR